MPIPAPKDTMVVGASPQGIATVKTMLDQYRSAIQAALPRHMTVDRMIRVAITSVNKNEKLLKCAPITLIGAVIQLAQLGLEPDDGTGKAYLIPFWNSKKNRYDVQAMAGYRGLVQLARNSGEIKSVMPDIVYEKDFFEYQKGTEKYLRHKPSEATDRGKPTHVYAIANYKNGETPDFDVMTIAQVEEIHDRVKQKNKGNDGVWATDYDEMCKKTVVRRLCKHLPSSPELQRAVTMDEKAAFGIPQDLGKLILPESETSSEAIEEAAPPMRLSESKLATPVLLNEKERTHILDLLDENGMKLPLLNAYLKDKYGIVGTENIASKDYAAVCSWISNGPEPEIPFDK